VSDASTIPTPATPDVCTMALLVEGKDVSGDLHVQSVIVNRELNRIPVATIQVQDGEAAKASFDISSSDRFLPGKKIEIQLGYRSQNETVFKGLIVKHRVKVRKPRR
jgi:phage protein D